MRVEDVVGPLTAHRQVWRDRRAPHPTAAAIDAVRAQLGDGPPDDPVFIFSAGWRSGSTLLQRMVLSSGDVLMWGEPWGRCDHVPRLAGALMPISASWPPPGAVIGDEHDQGEAYAQQWVAALFPSIDDLIEGHRAFFRTLYASPAAERGFTRWGVKETRYGIDEARYLHLLFPEARFVFLHRNPYDVWASYRALAFSAYVRWPTDPMRTAHRFGRLWRDLTTGFLEGAHEVGGIVVRYDELLADPGVTDRIADHLGVKIDPGAQQAHIGASPGKRLSAVEARLLTRAVGPLAEQLGYHA